MKLKLYTTDAAKASDVERDIPTFEGEKGVQALREVIIALQANQRQGTAKTKTRGEVSGTGKKPWRQKGTGNARHGSRRSPIWVGGGTAHGAKVRDHSKRTNRRVRLLALSRALFNTAEAGSLNLIEEVSMPEAKTKTFASRLAAIYPQRKRILIVDETFEDNAALSARNIAGVELLEAADLNALHLSQASQVLMSDKALQTVLTRINATATETADA